MTAWAVNDAYRWVGENGPRWRPFADVVDVAEQVLAEFERIRRRDEEGR